MAANLEGERKTAFEDFDKILGNVHTHTKPKIIQDAIKMLVAVSKMAVKLIGDQPCIASIEYSYAGELMGHHDWSIEENMNCIERFLIRVLHKINREIKLAFNAIITRCTRHKHPRLSSMRKSLQPSTQESRSSSGR